MDLASHFNKLGTDRLKVLGDYVLDCYIAHGSCCCHHKGSGFDLIRDDGVLCTMKLLNALDTDDISTCALYIGSHTVEEVGNINDVRFLSRVLDDGLTLCHSSCHHDVDGGSYADNIEVDVTSDKLISFGINDVLNVDLSTKRCKSLDMLVNRTKPDMASAGKCNSGILILAKKSSEQVVACPDLLDIIIFNCVVPDL